MRLLWHDKVKIEYVPIPSFGRYADLWDSEAYLKDCLSVGETKPYVVEVAQVISDMREKADKAPTVEALRAYNDCVEMAKSMLTLTQQAKRRLSDVKYRAKMEENNN